MKLRQRIFHNFMERMGFLRNRQHSCFQARENQQVINELVKPVGFLLNSLDEIALFVRLPEDIFGQQCGSKPDNGRQWGTQFMRDHRKELGFYLVGSLSFMARFFLYLEQFEVVKGDRGLVDEHFKMTQFDMIEMIFLFVINQQTTEPIPRCNQREDYQGLDFCFQQEITHQGRQTGIGLYPCDYHRPVWLEQLP